jgi:hypothetical protein
MLTPEQADWVLKTVIIVPGMALVGWLIGLVKAVFQRALIRRASAHTIPAVAESTRRIVGNDPHPRRGHRSTVR